MKDFKIKLFLVLSREKYAKVIEKLKEFWNFQRTKRLQIE